MLTAAVPAVHVGRDGNMGVLVTVVRGGRGVGVVVGRPRALAR